MYVYPAFIIHNFFGKVYIFLFDGFPALTHLVSYKRKHVEQVIFKRLQFWFYCWHVLKFIRIVL
ncbi:hypothetical protein BE21_57340 [Sorangium cellulosum]|uniref:Uncharacterized protein n=1 Tax=Sorangium cellulosum TaxID=56 RepID=A0A150T783_SORCE|nr:hypothetical protein BE21_57340 [Sorangium cellulosum]